MKTLKLLLLSVILALGTVQPASADRGYRGHDRHHHGHRYDHYRHHHHHRPQHYHRHGSSWGDAATAAIIIGAIGAATYGAFNQPEVHVAPPPAYVPPPQPQNRYWYYCASARQYYPYVNYCPEGWQQVLP